MRDFLELLGFGVVIIAWGIVMVAFVALLALAILSPFIVIAWLITQAVV